MEQRHCNNCGAPLGHSYNHKCPYCGTLFDFNEPEKDVVELHSYDLINVKFRDICDDPITNSLIMRFEGIKLEAPKIYEYNENTGIYLSKREEYINPPKSFFCISINKDELEHSGERYLRYIICNYIRPTEQENVMRQMGEIISKAYRYCKFERLWL